MVVYSRLSIGTAKEFRHVRKYSLRNICSFKKFIKDSKMAARTQAIGLKGFHIVLSYEPSSPPLVLKFHSAERDVE